MVHSAIVIHALDEGHRDWEGRLLEEAWGSTRVVSRGQIYDALALPGFVAIADGSPVGLVTYRPHGDQCELMTINSLRPRAGIGSALLRAVQEAAHKMGCSRLWLITTNDNLEALRFYQVNGFRLAALHRNALAVSRRLKPQIPEIGQHGIPLRDELELEMILANG